MTDEEHEEAQGYVLVEGLCYPIEEWVWYLNLAVLELLETRIPEGSSFRKVFRVLRDSRTKWVLKQAMTKTVELLEASDVEGILPDVVKQLGGVIAGVIPLDKPDAPR